METYAIVETGGKQYRVQKDDVIDIERIDSDEGATVSLDKVLLLADNGEIKVGKPIVTNAVISAEIVSHLRGKKVVAFKKKRRKGYKRKIGHRQELSRIRIADISVG